MLYFYDTEFIEDGKTIDLISIGIVREDGEEYYAVSSDMPISRINEHEWLMQNVWPSLPLTSNNQLSFGHRDVKPKAQIAEEVLDFLLKDATRDDLPELWAWFAAYDHVVLAQLWGVMINMPYGIPQYTKDLRQLFDEKKFDLMFMPKQRNGVHNALEDARHNKVKYDFLISKPWKE